MMASSNRGIGDGSFEEGFVKHEIPTHSLCIRGALISNSALNTESGSPRSSSVLTIVAIVRAAGPSNAFLVTPTESSPGFSMSII